MGFFEKLGLKKLKEGLGKTASGLKENITTALFNKKLDGQVCDELEDALLQADMGASLAEKLVRPLREGKFEQDITPEDVQTHLSQAIADILKDSATPLEIDESKKPFVILMVGVNGSGKTTTIGKLTKKLQDGGKKVMLAAADTYRAAAVKQLDVWAGRTKTPIVKPEKEGADPASLLYKAYESAEEQGVDVLICDTAGRLQNRQDLMAQLEKMVRVLRKKDESAPHASLLVLDATVGQNAHSQVETFKEIAYVTGLVVTKLDSTAKGGVVVSLADKYKLPIHFIGVGEQVEDLKPFNPQDFAKALFG